MRREGIDTIDQDQDQGLTEGTEAEIEIAIPDLLADDMYTSPTQLNITTSTVQLSTFYQNPTEQRFLLLNESQPEIQ